MRGSGAGGPQWRDDLAVDGCCKVEMVTARRGTKAYPKA